jgi:hypothetical protein
MRITKRSCLVGAVLSVGCFWGVVQAAEDVRQQIPAKQQVKLLQQYGDQGIDANADGVLTRTELRDFRQKNRAGRVGGDQVPIRSRDRLREPGQGFGPGPGMGRRGLGGPAMMLQRFVSPTPPPDFNLTTHPEEDLDGDGVISDAEWRTFADARIKQLIPRALRQSPGIDADGDGEVSHAELTTFVAAEEAKRRSHLLVDHPELDTDNDGVLSDTEMEAHKMVMESERLAQMLERHPEADTDGDGVLSKEEADAFRDTLPRRGPGGRFERGPQRGRGW